MAKKIFLKNKDNMSHIVEYGFHKSLNFGKREKKEVSEEILKSKAAQALIKRGVLKETSEEVA